MKLYLNRDIKEGESFSDEWAVIRRGKLAHGSYLIITIPIPIRREVRLSATSTMDPICMKKWEMGWFFYAWCQKEQYYNGLESKIGIWRWLPWKTKFYD